MVQEGEEIAGEVNFMSNIPIHHIRKLRVMKEGTKCKISHNTTIALLVLVYYTEI